MNRITIHHAWAEVERDPKGDWTLLCPCEGRPLNQEAANRAANRASQAMDALPGETPGNPTDASEAVRRVFAAAVGFGTPQRLRGAALLAPRPFRPEWTFRASRAVLLVWGLDQGFRLHVRVVLRDVPKGWIGMASTMPFGLAPWPDHWPHSGDPEAPSLKDDPTLWRVLYPELDPPPRPHTFQHRELLYAAMDEPGDPLHWDALADAVEEQDEDPSRERFASRLLREMILPGGARVAPGLVRREESR